MKIVTGRDEKLGTDGLAPAIQPLRLSWVVGDPGLTLLRYPNQVAAVMSKVSQLILIHDLLTTLYQVHGPLRLCRFLFSCWFAMPVVGAICVRGGWRNRFLFNRFHEPVRGGGSC